MKHPQNIQFSNVLDSLYHIQKCLTNKTSNISNENCPPPLQVFNSDADCQLINLSEIYYFLLEVPL